jgi:hypothetical protein
MTKVEIFKTNPRTYATLSPKPPSKFCSAIMNVEYYMQNRYVGSGTMDDMIYLFSKVVPKLKELFPEFHLILLDVD